MRALALLSLIACIDDPHPLLFPPYCAYKDFLFDGGGRLQGRLCIEGVLLQPISCALTLVENLGGPQQREIGTMPLCDPNGQPSGACGAVVQDPFHCPQWQTEILYCWNGFDPSNPSKPCPDGPNGPPNATIVVECAVECQ